MKKMGLIFTIIMSSFFVGCASWMGYSQKPEVELNNVYVKDANLSGATIVLVFDVENPNDKEIAVKEIGYTVYVGGKHLTTAKTDREISIPAKQIKGVEVPLPIKYKDLFANISEILSAGQLKYKVQGDAKFSILSVPFAKEGSVELPKLF